MKLPYEKERSGKRLLGTSIADRPGHGPLSRQDPPQYSVLRYLSCLNAALVGRVGAAEQAFVSLAESARS